jgi:hypothetical protein
LQVRVLGGCAFERAEIAQDARAQMVGMTKNRFLACIGARATRLPKAPPSFGVLRPYNATTVASASCDRYGGTAVSSSQFCNINIVFAGGQVSAVNYTGPTEVF